LPLSLGVLDPMQFSHFSMKRGDALLKSKGKYYSKEEEEEVEKKIDNSSRLVLPGIITNNKKL
jgi:hypothetical protein